MIKKIREIHHKSFNQYNSLDLNFNTINLLYGRNGQGKTSLIHFIKSNIEQNNLDIFETSYSSFQIYFYDTKYRDSLFFSNDRFKSFYIAEGVENLVLTRKILEKRVNNLQIISIAVQKRINKTDDKEAEIKSKIAKNTRSVLEIIDSEQFKNPQSYTSRKVVIPNQFDEDNELKLVELDNMKLKTKNMNYEKIECFLFTQCPKIKKGVEALEEILKQTPENSAIERFKNDNELEKFAKMALDIKNKTGIYNEKCPLCEQNILGIGLWENLEKHFNMEYDYLMKRLEKAEEFFEKSKKELEEYKKWLIFYISKSRILTSCDLDIIRQKHIAFIDNSLNEIDKLIKLIRNKKNSISQPILDIDINLGIFDQILSDEIIKIIHDHNLLQANYIKDVEKNIEKIKKHFVYIEKDEVIKNRKNNLALKNKKQKIECLLKKRTEQIRNIDDKLKEHDKSFAVLNKDLNNWFYEDIQFVKIGDAHYRIQRQDFRGNWFDCDSGLSEGEKIVVAIIYFAKYYLSEVEKSDKFPIIFLDDPINSLDNFNRDKIVNYIVQHILKQRGQFFVSTHLDEICSKFEKRLSRMKDKRGLFEIVKINQESQIKMLDKFKLSDQFYTVHSRLENFLETQQYEQINDVRHCIRVVFEQIFNIYFGDWTNFTDCYNEFFKKKSFEKIYEADDLQDLNHAKNKSNNDEVSNKIKFVLDIVTKIRQGKDI